jgi:hypothetical protein
MTIFACLGISAPAFAISITAMDSGADMAQSLVGSGIMISNVTYTGANAASGYFKGGLDAGIGIEEGIVLTSGNASNIDGTTNKASDTTGEMGTAGNAELDALIPGATTTDAAVLEFDFVSMGDAAYFNYVFGSEEYNEWVDSEFNDVFGFFIDDVNYALLPKTSTPVSINSVNNGSNSEHYNDNDYDDFWPESPFAFEYDGFTDVLTASITGLTVGQTYHLKLAIADTNDAFWDSGVFLEAGSFSEQQPSGVPEPSTMFLLVSGIGGLVIFRKKFMK